MNKLVLSRWLSLLTILIFTLLVWLIIFNHGQKTLTVAFLDVGQGDAIFIEAPNGNQVLIDGGAGRQVLRELGEVMPFYDKTIDLVIATHPDADHIGGLTFVLDKYKVLGVAGNGVKGSTSVYKSFSQKVELEQGQYVTARAGMKIVLDTNVFIDIIFPNTDMNQFEANEGSVTLRLVYGHNEFIFTGDLPQHRELELARRYGEHLEADVLKLGHHGSQTSSSAYFLDIVQPKLAVVSAGRDNRYGHPHQVVTDRLKDKNISYLNTADLGTITLESDGNRLICKKCGR